MRAIRLTHSIVIALLMAGLAHSQSVLEPTRFTIAGAPAFFQPKGDYGRNIGAAFGGGGALLYRLDQPGLLSLRFDVSGIAYGHEKKQVPLSESIGGRVLVNATTTNSLLMLSLGPEVALPRGPVRPYLNTGLSRLFFRTTSAVKGIDSSEGDIAHTTNYSDSVNAWFVGGGIRVPFGGKPAFQSLSFDLGLRYYAGGVASYLREGSIQDNPDGSISITALTSRTPQMVYLVGVRFRIPHNSSKPCPRFVC